MGGKEEGPDLAELQPGMTEATSALHDRTTHSKLPVRGLSRTLTALFLSPYTLRVYSDLWLDRPCHFVTMMHMQVWRHMGIQKLDRTDGGVREAKSGWKSTREAILSEGDAMDVTA